VLFLRRFGYDDATSAVTFAVAKTIGSSWRLVTLDDAELSPIGVTIGTRRLFQVGRGAWSIIRVVGLLPLRVFPVVVIAMWLIVGAALFGPAASFARTGNSNWEQWIVAIQPYVNILSALLALKLPFEAVCLNLPGVFAVLGITAAVMFVGLFAMMAALISSLLFSAVLFFVSASSNAVWEPERSKTVEVRTAGEIRDACLKIAARSRKVFELRVLVLRVASANWRSSPRCV